MNPVEGTEILFFEEGKWWNKNSAGLIVPTNTYEYYKRYQKRNSLVVVDDNELSTLNDGQITVITNKFTINRPDLKSFEFTTEWMSLKHFLLLRKQTDVFCHIAKKFNIPER